VVLSFVPFIHVQKTFLLSGSLLILIGVLFSFALFYARESGKGKPMNFREVLKRHGNHAEWKVEARDTNLSDKWTGLVSEHESGAIYFVCFTEEDVPDFDRIVNDLNRYFGAQLLVPPYGGNYNYAIYPK